MKKTYGSVTIETAMMPKRGQCLKISKSDGVFILADFCGMNPMLVPDGTNAYFFGNKLIFVTRWSDMSDEEKNTVESDEITVAVHGYKCVQFSIKVGDNWGDVMTTLHNFSKAHNDVYAPVDEMIFVFADTHDGDYIIERSVKLPKELQDHFQRAITYSYQYFNVDGMMDEIRQKAAADPHKDEFDFLYDVCYDHTTEFSRAARRADPENIPDGLYIRVTSDNTIAGSHREEAETEEMSQEAKLYLQLAEKGIAEGQYNLGVCYEQGDGVRQNYKKAAYWYQQAADLKYAKAQYNLGVLYYQGAGVEQDHARAAKLFEQSADHGDIFAQYNLAVLLLQGDGIEKDVLRSFELLKKAAAGGHPQAKQVIAGLPL